MTRRAFIIGGTGQIGRATALDLAERGWQVTVSTRGDPSAVAGFEDSGVKVVTLDRDEPGALAKALYGGADAVIDTIAFTEAHAEQLLQVQGDAGALVVISTAAVYRDAAGRSMIEAGETGFPHFPEPILETQATVDPGPASYSTRKAAIEQRLLQHATAPVIILRPCAIHGPWSKHPREWWFIKRMLDARPVIPLAYLGKSRFHTSATANIAALTAVALDQPATRLLNAADPDSPSVTEIGRLIADHMRYAGRFLPLDVGDDKGEAEIGVTPWSTPGPFVIDTQAALALGYRPATRYPDAVPGLCDWLVARRADWKAAFPVFANYASDPFDYAAEDAILAELP